MQRRKFLVGMGSLAAGGTAVLGTGAFNTVEATRAINISTTEDTDAFLSLNPTVGQNSQYTGYDGDNTVVVNLDKINRDAITNIFELFRVENNGTTDVIVWVPPANGISPDRVGPDRSFANPGGGSGEVYVDPQATGMPNEPDPFSLTGVYGSQIPPSLLAYDGTPNPAGSTAADDDDGGSDEQPGASIADRRIEPGQSFNFGLNIQHEASDTFPDIDVVIKAVDDDLL